MGIETCKAGGAQLWKRLRSPRLTLIILITIALYTGLLVWLPWAGDKTVVPPQWAVLIGIDRPFSSIPFLTLCVILFFNTFACTWERAQRVWKIWLGDISPLCLITTENPSADIASFLASQGFRKNGGTFFRNRFALWGGLVLHVGILFLLVSVTVQRSCFDGASFELAEGETIHLVEKGAVFSRDKGWLAPVIPPDLEMSLISFDPFLHQKGYAPDRASTLRIAAPDGRIQVAQVDRARGVALGDSTIYQAIPSGIALTLSIPGMGTRSVHLRAVGKKTAEKQIQDTSGNDVIFRVMADRQLNDPLGTGQLKITLERGSETISLEPGVPFDFGAAKATILTISRWGGFTYSRSPGMSLVIAGFCLILIGCILMVFPTGVVRIAGAGDGSGFFIHCPRGQEVLISEWENYCASEAHSCRSTT